MMNFFDKIIEFLDLVWGMIINLLNGLVALADMIIQIPIVTNVVFGYLPPVVFAGITATVAITTVKLLVGRTGSQ